MIHKALLILENGRVFEGTSIGADGAVAGEIVFNTAMSGYQEILTDPSYADQLVVFTCPHIGNVGVNSQDTESNSIHARGMLINTPPMLDSSWRSEGSLGHYLQQNNIVAIAGIDTRALTACIRDEGAMKACIYTKQPVDSQEAKLIMNQFAGLKGKDLAKQVTCSEPYQWQGGLWGQASPEVKTYKVVAIDFGVKHNILRHLDAIGADVTVVPAQTTFHDIIQHKPDGVFLSNGPGDPSACDYAIETVRQLLEAKIPVFGICLGYQILALSCGAQTIKMKFGHHGANHPVKALASSTVMITSQNHGFAVNEDTLPEDLVVTHRSLFDNTLQGLSHSVLPAFGFQGHPEASPGPTEASVLFHEFAKLMTAYQNNHSSQIDSKVENHVKTN